MSLPEVRNLPLRDYQYMLAYTVKHPSGARAEAFFQGNLLALLTNKSINREEFPEGVTAQDMIPWLNQEIPDSLLSSEELTEREDKHNREVLASFDW